MTDEGAAAKPDDNPVIQRFVETGGQEAAAASVAQAAAMAFTQEATAQVAQDAFIASYKPVPNPENKREKGGNPLLNPIKKIGLDLAAVRASMEARLRSRTSRKMPGEASAHVDSDQAASGSFSAVAPAADTAAPAGTAGAPYVTAQWMQPSTPATPPALNTVPPAGAAPRPPKSLTESGETGELPIIRSAEPPRTDEPEPAQSQSFPHSYAEPQPHETASNGAAPEPSSAEPLAETGVQEQPAESKAAQSDTGGMPSVPPPTTISALAAAVPLAPLPHNAPQAIPLAPAKPAA
ncbi:MAG: hypothetical protein ACRD3W_04700, partial [Terriglobales bacterium]